MKVKYLTFVECLAIVFVGLFVIALVLPLFNSGGSRYHATMQLHCASNLKSIGTNLMMYTDDNDDYYPTGGSLAHQGLNLLVDGNYQTPAKSFNCPLSTADLGTGTLLQGTNKASIDFLYLPIGRVNAGDSEAILVRDRKGNHASYDIKFHNFLFADGTRVKVFKNGIKEVERESKRKMKPFITKEQRQKLEAEKKNRE